MPDELYDQDGYQYERNWAGNWVEKQGLFGGHDHDSSPAYDREPARGGLFGGQEYSWDGKPLYRKRDSDDGGGSSGGYGLEGLLALLLLILYLAVLAVTLAVIATPILAPLFLKHSESLEKRGATKEAVTWRNRGRIASIVAIPIVPLLATMLGVGLISAIFASTAELQFLFIIISIPTLIIPLTIIGLYPTAKQYLRHFPISKQNGAINDAPGRLFVWIINTTQAFIAKIRFSPQPLYKWHSSDQNAKSNYTVGTTDRSARQPIARLVSGQGQSHPMTVEPFLIGRSKVCDLRLTDKDASRVHARICFAHGSWYIQDQDSAAGIYINGQRQAAVRLYSGDQIQICSHLFTFYPNRS